MAEEKKTTLSSEPVDVEILLQDEPNRLVLFPILYKNIWKMYKKHEAAFWTSEEIDLEIDEKDWFKLNAGEQHFLKMILAFFASADTIVAENLVQRFMREIKILEVRCFYGFQFAIENIHSETYSLLIDTLIKDASEKIRLFNAVQNVPCIQAKAKWAMKWIESKSATFAERLIAFAAVEGVFFSGAFCSIFWFKKKGLMPGLTYSNELISRDEGMHCDFACLLYSMLSKKLTQKRVEEIIKSAVDIEKEFIVDALSVSIIGINAEMMTMYVQSVADHLLDHLGYEKCYNVANPFSWMEMISLTSKTNFHEKRVSEYANLSITSRDSEEKNSYLLDGKF